MKALLNRRTRPWRLFPVVSSFGSRSSNVRISQLLGSLVNSEKHMLARLVFHLHLSSAVHKWARCTRWWQNIYLLDPMMGFDDQPCGHVHSACFKLTADITPGGQVMFPGKASLCSVNIVFPMTFRMPSDRFLLIYLYSRSLNLCPWPDCWPKADALHKFFLTFVFLCLQMSQKRLFRMRPRLI